jgi:hypothetical protein
LLSVRFVSNVLTVSFRFFTQKMMIAIKVKTITHIPAIPI